MKTSSTPSEIELKIKVFKFLEIAYKEDETITAALIKDSAPFSLSVDSSGVATISGKAGNVKFSVSDEIKEYGIDFRYVRAMFSGNRNGIIRYNLSFGIGAEVMLTGLLDVEYLLLNCSGLLCRAFRAYKFRAQMLDKTIRAQIGN